MWIFQQKRYLILGLNHLLFYFAFALGLLVLFVFNYGFIFREQHFIYLADSFLHKKLYFLPAHLEILSTHDTSFYLGSYYWPLGFIPALLLLPFVAAFGDNYSQGLMNFPLVVSTAALLYLTYNFILEDKTKALFLTFTYIFSTAYFGVASVSISWYFAHTVATFFSVFSIYMAIVRKSYLSAGVFFMLSFLTRMSMGLSIFFYIFYIFKSNVPGKSLYYSLAKFLFPVVLGILLFFIYNHARFGDILLTGYAFQNVDPDLGAMRAGGLWSLKHYPLNLSLFFLQGPKIIFEEGSRVLKELKAPINGMSFFITSPIYLAALFSRFKDKLSIAALFGLIPTALFVFGWFGLGGSQYGYRLALDFQPFLFLIIAVVIGNLKSVRWLTLAVIASALLNFYFIWNTFFSAAL